MILIELTRKIIFSSPVVMVRNHVTYGLSPAHQKLFNDLKSPKLFTPARNRFWIRWGTPVLIVYSIIKFGGWKSHQLEVAHRP